MAPTDNTDYEEKRGAHLRIPDHLKAPKRVRVTTGKPRGRALGQKNKKTLRLESNGGVFPFKNPDHLKKPAYVPTGKPRGRAPGQKNKNTMRMEKRKQIMEEVAKLREGGNAKK